MFKEFREFAMKGNVVDLAVGVIIGGAFGKIVDSLVGDIIMPLVGKFLGAVDFSQLFINLGSTHYDTLAAAKQAGAPTLAYGNFLQVVVNFLIIALVIFLMVKALNSMKRAEEAAPAAPAAPPEDIVLLREIRDALRQK